MSTSENPCRILYVRRVGLKRFFVAALFGGTVTSWIAAGLYGLGKITASDTASAQDMNETIARMLVYIFFGGPIFAIVWTIMAAIANSYLSGHPLKVELADADGPRGCQEGGERQADKHD